MRIFFISFVRVFKSHEVDETPSTELTDPHCDKNDERLIEQHSSVSDFKLWLHMQNRAMLNLHTLEGWFISINQAVVSVNGFSGDRKKSIWRGASVQWRTREKWMFVSVGISLMLKWNQVLHKRARTHTHTHTHAYTHTHTQCWVMSSWTSTLISWRLTLTLTQSLLA